MFSGRTNAIQHGSELDDVEIELENFFLGERLLEVGRQNRLLQLAGEVFLPPEVEVFGKLHGDRAGPAHEPALAQVVADGILDGRFVESLVRAKPAVFGGGERRLEV